MMLAVFPDVLYNARLTVLAIKVCTEKRAQALHDLGEPNKVKLKLVDLYVSLLQLRAQLVAVTLVVVTLLSQLFYLLLAAMVVVLLWPYAK